MADTLTKTERSNTMSKVRSRDTKPEFVLRCALHELGFRYSLKNKHLPGNPDLVLPKYRAAIFVHGCYWHRHSCCKDASMPKSNVVFWENKFAENIQRDRNKIKELANNGFRVFVVWECELLKHTVETIRRVAFWIKQEPGQYDYVVNRKKLLAVAEQKVQHRIALYDLKSALSNIGKNEGQEK